MPDIVRELTIAATPERVFDALTQPGEIGQWWTNDLNASPEVGSLAELRFGEWGEFVFRFEIAELDQNKKVHWITRQGLQPDTGKGPALPGASPLSTGGHRWSSRIPGLLKLLGEMKLHARGVGAQIGHPISVLLSEIAALPRKHHPSLFVKCSV